MHEKLDYFFSLLRNAPTNNNNIVSKKEILEHLLRASESSDIESLKEKSPYITTLITSGACKGEFIDLSYDSSLYHALKDLVNKQATMWLKAYFSDNNGFARDISIIESKASENIAAKVRGDYIEEIFRKTNDSAVAYSLQNCSHWLQECAIKSALTHKKNFTIEDFKYEISTHVKDIVEKHINKVVEIEKGNHLRIAN